MDAYEILKWPLTKLWEYQAFFLADSKEFKEKIGAELPSNGKTSVAAVERLLNSVRAK